MLCEHVKGDCIVRRHLFVGSIRKLTLPIVPSPDKARMEENHKYDSNVWRGQLLILMAI